MATTTIEKPIPTGEGLTFEKVWAMFQETDRKMQETAQMVRENTVQMKETDRKMKETDRRIGELGNRFGELAEHLVAPGIADRFNELGYHFDGVIPGGYEIHDPNGKSVTQVDIMLENGDCIMAVEVKSRPRKQDIEHHIRRLEILRRYRSNKNDFRKIMGAIAGAVFGAEEKEAAIEAGFYVIEQSGDTMVINMPQDFVPGEW